MNKVLRIFEWIFTIISILAIVFGIIWFGYIVYYTMQESNLGTGFGIAFGLIFNLIADGVCLASSIIGIILCLIERRTIKDLANKGLLISNITMIVLSLVLFLIILILV